MIKREMILAQNPWLTDVSVVAETAQRTPDAKNDPSRQKIIHRRYADTNTWSLWSAIFCLQW